MMANTEESPCEEEDAHLGSLRILNAINAWKELPTVEAKNKVRVMSSKIDAKRQRALVDPGVGQRIHYSCTRDSGSF